MRVSQGSGLPGRTGTTKRGNRLTGDLIVYAGLFPWTNNILYIIDDLYGNQGALGLVMNHVVW